MKLKHDGKMMRGALAAIAVGGMVAMAETSARPNLLFVIPDQFRQSALSFWRQPEYQGCLPTISDPVETANLDRLASRSVVFTNAYSINPVCSPYRAMMMSSRYQHENGVPSNCHSDKPFGLKENIVCFTDVLAANGYDTAYIGKTHWSQTVPVFDENKNYVGPEGGKYINPYDTYIPAGRGRLGNRYWMQTIGDNHSRHLIYSNQPSLVGGKKDGEAYESSIYGPKYEADAVIGYLENRNGERPKGKPFSVFWSPNPPHPPYSSAEYVEKDVYEKMYKGVVPSKLLVRKNVQEVVGKGSMNARNCVQYYFSHVFSVDRQIGRILKALEESGEADNTVIVFTSDHGEMMGSHGLMGKTKIYTEAFNVPLMICYPRKLAHRLENVRFSPLDMMPTLLGLLGLGDKVPEGARGTDYSRGIAFGDFAATPKPDVSFFSAGPKRGIVTDRYTFEVTNKRVVTLFDNVADPYQMKNLTLEQIPEADALHLRRRLGRELVRTNDPWVKKKVAADIVIYGGK